MSTDEYVPSEDEVRGRYCDGTYMQTGHTSEGDDFDAWLAGVRRDAKAEALRNLPPHLSLKVHQCTARESGGGYCELELSHSCGHRILDVPDGWILGAVDRCINSIEQEPTR